MNMAEKESDEQDVKSLGVGGGGETQVSYLLKKIDFSFLG